MQLRNVPVNYIDQEIKLDLVADCIYKYAFTKQSISNQTSCAVGSEKAIKGPQTAEKIAKALKLMQNENLEVSIMAFCRKEEFLPELHVTDFWCVCDFGVKWTATAKAEGQDYGNLKKRKRTSPFLIMFEYF